MPSDSTKNVVPLVTKSCDETFDQGLSAARSRLQLLVSEAQVVAGHLATADRDQARHLMTVFSTRIPTPGNRLEQILVRSILLEFAFKTGLTVHDQLHCGGVRRCTFSPTSILDQFW